MSQDPVQFIQDTQRSMNSMGAANSGKSGHVIVMAHLTFKTPTFSRNFEANPINFNDLYNLRSRTAQKRVAEAVLKITGEILKVLEQHPTATDLVFRYRCKLVVD